MSSTAADYLDNPTLILYEVAHLDTKTTETNAYEWLAASLRRTYLPHYSRSAISQIRVNVALLAVAAALIVTSLVMRVKKRQCWWFRRHKLGGGGGGRASSSGHRWNDSAQTRLIQPNLAFVGGTLGLVILSLTMFLYLTVIEATEDDFPLYMGYVSLLLGAFPCLVGEVAIWSLCSSFLIHLHSRDSNRPSLGRYIVVSNVFGAVAPLLHVAVFVPLDVVAGKRYHDTVSTFLDLEQTLMRLGQDQDENQDLSAMATEVVPLVDRLVKQFQHLKPVWQANYIFESIATALLVGSVSVIAGMYFTSVRRLIQRAKEAYRESGRGGELLDEVYRTWIGLVGSIVLFVVIAAITFGLSVFAAARPLTLSERYILASFWSDTMLSVTMASVLFWLSWILEPKRRPLPPTTTFFESSQQALSTSTMTTTTVEGARNPAGPPQRQDQGAGRRGLRSTSSCSDDEFDENDCPSRDEEDEKREPQLDSLEEEGRSRTAQVTVGQVRAGAGARSSIWGEEIYRVVAAATAAQAQAQATTRTDRAESDSSTLCQVERGGGGPSVVRATRLDSVDERETREMAQLWSNYTLK